MFVTQGAVKLLKGKRKEQFFDNYVKNLIEEAIRLDISKEEVIKLLERGYE